MEMNFYKVHSLQIQSKVNQTHFKKDGIIWEKFYLLSIQSEYTLDSNLEKLKSEFRICGAHENIGLFT